MTSQPILYTFNIAAIFASLTPLSASAHTLSGNGFISGISHPLLGIDHLLAMVAVGIISTIIGGKIAWKLPLLFVTFMCLGGILGMLGIHLPGVEYSIALSVLLSGIIIAYSKKIPFVIPATATMLFALAHGHAHGAEMPNSTQPVIYILGFVLATLSLHLSGVAIGHYAKKHHIALTALRYTGAGISMVGTFLIVGIL